MGFSSGRPLRSAAATDACSDRSFVSAAITGACSDRSFLFAARVEICSDGSLVPVAITETCVGRPFMFAAVPRSITGDLLCLQPLPRLAETPDRKNGRYRRRLHRNRRSPLGGSSVRATGNRYRRRVRPLTTSKHSTIRRIVHRAAGTTKTAILAITLGAAHVSSSARLEAKETNRRFWARSRAAR